MNTRLICTVDTEEEGLWSGTYRARGNTVENVCGVGRFQDLCDQYGVRPTYLVDAPIVQDRRAVELLRSIQDSGRCEIGGHVHPWCNPPFEEEICEQNSYLCNLTPDLQRRKIEWLTDEIERRFGGRPSSFRAGRYGLDASGARILAELGYSVDSSVIPFTDYSSSGGPNFDCAPCSAYFPSESQLGLPGRPGPLLEVPVTVGYNRRNFERAHAVRRIVMRPPMSRLRMAGILSRTGLVRRIKLSPEQAHAGEMARLIDLAAARGATCLVMMFHSSSLMPGGSPYVPDATALERFLRRIAAVFEHFVHRRGGRPATLTEYSSQFRRDAESLSPDASPQCAEILPAGGGQ